MRPHLSCIDDPALEFQAPDGHWLLIHRAIVYDGWLLWKDALPQDQALRSRLDRIAYEGIETLARQIHVVHQLMPDYRSLLLSPFHVSRWWDPDDDDPLWRSGRGCLIKLSGYTSREFQQVTPKKSRLLVRCVTDQWIEFTLPPPEPVAHRSSQPAPAVGNKTPHATPGAGMCSDPRGSLN